MDALKWDPFATVPTTPEAAVQLIAEVQRLYGLFLQLGYRMDDAEAREVMPGFIRGFREKRLQGEPGLRLGPLISGLSFEIMFTIGGEDGLEYLQNINFWRALIESPTLMLEFVTALDDWTSAWYIASRSSVGFHEILTRRTRTVIGRRLAISHSLQIPYEETELTAEELAELSPERPDQSPNG